MFKKKIIEESKKEKVNSEKSKGKREQKKESSTGFTIKALLIPFAVAAVVVCLIYLVMVNASKNEVAKAPVVCAVKDIDQNTYISAEKVGEYFEVKEVEAAILPDNIYSSLDDFPDDGFYVETDLAENQMPSENDICKKDEIMDKYVEGTEITSIAVDAFDNSVSGTIRHGDIVDVYAVDPETNQLMLMVSNVYVEGAYDNSGNELTEEYEAENGVGTATVFSVKVAPDEIESMNEAINDGGIQIYLTNK